MRVFPWLCSACFAVAALALGGCTTSQTVIGCTDELKQEAGIGYIAMTLVHRTDSPDPSLVLRELPSIDAVLFRAGEMRRAPFHINTTARGGNVSGLWDAPGVALSEPQGRRVMTILKVPAGRYVLTQVHATVPAFRLYMLINPKYPPVVEVREGQVTYAGSIQLTSQVTKTYFGHARPTTAQLRLSDDAAVDVPAMRRADPRLARLSFIDGLQGHQLDTLSATTQVAPERSAPAK
jgi:hypothetical protein